MAGSEKTGYENSTDHLLENAYYILTPTDKTPDTSVAMMTQTASLIGAIPLVLDYREHDRIVAAVSHLPHIIASSLVNLVRDKDGSQGLMKRLAAGGFKDITRIASASPCYVGTDLHDKRDEYCLPFKRLYRLPEPHFNRSGQPGQRLCQRAV